MHRTELQHDGQSDILLQFATDPVALGAQLETRVDGALSSPGPGDRPAGFIPAHPCEVLTLISDTLFQYPEHIIHE